MSSSTISIPWISYPNCNFMPSCFWFKNISYHKNCCFAVDFFPFLLNFCKSPKSIFFLFYIFSITKNTSYNNLRFNFRILTKFFRVLSTTRSATIFTQKDHKKLNIMTRVYSSNAYERRKIIILFTILIPNHEYKCFIIPILPLLLYACRRFIWNSKIF